MMKIIPMLAIFAAMVLLVLTATVVLSLPLKTSTPLENAHNELTHNVSPEQSKEVESPTYHWKSPIQLKN